MCSAHLFCFLKNINMYVLIHFFTLFIIFLTVCYYHVTYQFHSESTLNSVPECQGTPCSKQAPYLKFKWQQRDSNPQFTQKLPRNIITIYSQMHRLDKYSQHTSIIKKKISSANLDKWLSVQVTATWFEPTTT